jgi:hypothetical protein
LERSEHWLNRERLTVYPRMILALLLTEALVWVLLSKDMVDPMGKPLGYDFIAFWAASLIGLTGSPENAYNIPVFFAAVENTVPGLQGAGYAWFYPPTYYLVVLPLARLPYLAAYFTFVLTTLTAYVAVFRRVAKGPDAMWLLAAFPGVYINFFHGQNGFLTAALAAAALLCLGRRPVWSGVFIGLLAIKPHLAVLFPVALIAIGAWRTFITAGLVAAVFLAIGTAVLGTPTLFAWLDSVTMARIYMETEALLWAKAPTVFAMMRMVGLPVPVAYIMHGIVACGAIAAVWVVWRRPSTLPVRGAALLSATFLVSPYLFEYDLAWLAFPIAWLAQAGLREGWLRGEREVLVAAWVLPIIMAPLAMAVPLQIGPLVLVALLGAVVRRACVRQ